MNVNKLSYTLFLVVFVNPLSYTNTKKTIKKPYNFITAILSIIYKKIILALYNGD